jgi:hypothetical protein
MKPFPNRTGTFQRIRLSLACESLPRIKIDNQHYPKTILDPGGIATVVLRLVIGFTVSPGGHNSTDYYDHSAPHHD